MTEEIHGLPSGGQRRNLKTHNRRQASVLQNPVGAQAGGGNGSAGRLHGGGSNEMAKCIWRQRHFRQREEQGLRLHGAC